MFFTGYRSRVHASWLFHSPCIGFQVNFRWSMEGLFQGRSIQARAASLQTYHSEQTSSYLEPGVVRFLDGTGVHQSKERPQASPKPLEWLPQIPR